MLAENKEANIMKRAVLTHPKLYDLASRLNCDRPCAIGYLTLLWDFVAEHAACGDIGRWPDGAIARACDWRGDPNDFVGALIGAGWVDVSGVHRLIIHDWAKHCEKWVTLKLSKLDKHFVTAEASTEATAEATAEAIAEGSSPSPSPSPVFIPSLIAEQAPRDKKEVSKERQKDLVWEAVIQVCGLEGGTPTSRERGAWNGAVKALRDAGATPGEVRARAVCYRSRWPNVSLTPTALARRWTECVAEVIA